MRFFQPTPTQYIPQYTPLNLELMNQTLDAREQDDLKAEDLLSQSENDLRVKGGLYSKPEEVQQVNDYLQSNISNVAEKFHSGELNAKEAVLNINKLKTFYNTHPSVQFFKADEKLTDATKTAMVQGKLNNAVSPNATYFNKQLKINRPVSWKEGEENLSTAYNFITPSSISDENNYGKHYNALKASSIAEEYAGQNGLQLKRNADNMPYIVNQTTGQIDEILTWQMVYDLGKQLAKNELPNSSTPYIQYKQSLYGDKYGENEFGTDFANGFVGTYFKTATTDKKDFNVLEGMWKAEQEAAAAAGALYSPYEATTTNVAPLDTEWGINPGKFFTSLFGSTDDLPKNLNIDDLDNPNTKTGLRIANVATPDERTKYRNEHPYENSTPNYSVVQPYDLPETEKKYFENWLKNNSKHGYMYKHYIQNNPNNMDINAKKLVGIYKDFFKDMKEYNKDIVRTATTTSSINYYSPAQIKETSARNLNEANYMRNAANTWTYFAGNKSSATINDILINATKNGLKIWDTANKEYLTPDNQKTLSDTHGITSVPSLGRTNPENLLNMLTGDETFKNAVTFASPDGNLYMIQDPTFNTGNNKGELVVNEMYRKGKMALGQPIKYKWDDNHDINYKIDKDNQVILLNPKNGKEIQLFTNAAEMMYTLSTPNNPFIKEALYESTSKPKSKPVTKPTTGKK
jgi:hypothetical protein